LTFKKYWSLTDKQVLAYNLYLCGTGGSPPFYANCIYGVQNELRGYEAGRYIDRYMLATQLEYRLVLPWRFGFVTFGGIGGVASGDLHFRNENFLPAAGGRIAVRAEQKVSRKSARRHRARQERAHVQHGGGRSILRNDFW
jgi:hypothetical protein